MAYVFGLRRANGKILFYSVCLFEIDCIPRVERYTNFKFIARTYIFNILKLLYGMYWDNSFFILFLFYYLLKDRNATPITACTSIPFTKQKSPSSWHLQRLQLISGEKMVTERHLQHIPKFYFGFGWVSYCQWSNTFKPFMDIFIRHLTVTWENQNLHLHLIFSPLTIFSTATQTSVMPPKPLRRHKRLKRHETGPWCRRRNNLNLPTLYLRLMYKSIEGIRVKRADGTHKPLLYSLAAYIINVYGGPGQEKERDSPHLSPPLLETFLDGVRGFFFSLSTFLNYGHGGPCQGNNNKEKGPTLSWRFTWK